jgi:hypothetical protein
MEKQKTNREVMIAHIEACHASGISVTNYCEEYSLPKSKYYYWQKRLNSSKPVNSFKQIAPVQNHNFSSAPVVINFPNGVQVAFNGSVNPQVLKELICYI